MNKERNQIFIILAISIFLAMLRYLILDDDYRFSLVKEPKKEQIYQLPDSLSEPMPLSLELVKSIFDSGNAIFIDARDEDLYSSSTIKGSSNISYFLVDEQDQNTIDDISQLNKDNIYIVFCDGEEAGCEISFNLSEILFYEYEFKNVYIYEGGMYEWKEKGYPLDEK